MGKSFPFFFSYRKPRGGWGSLLVPIHSAEREAQCAQLKCHVSSSMSPFKLLFCKVQWKCNLPGPLTSVPLGWLWWESKQRETSLLAHSLIWAVGLLQCSPGGWYVLFQITSCCLCQLSAYSISPFLCQFLPMTLHPHLLVFLECVPKRPRCLLQFIKPESGLLRTHKTSK